MRRLWIALLLASLLCSACGLSLQAIRREIAPITEAVRVDAPDIAFARWEQAQNLLGSLLLHDELDDAERLLIRLCSRAEEKGDEYEADRAELLDTLTHLTQLDAPILKNLF